LERHITSLRAQNQADTQSQAIMRPIQRGAKSRLGGRLDGRTPFGVVG
jgi:hypothetical protein